MLLGFFILTHGALYADYNLDYKIILDSEDYRDYYRLTTNIDDVIYVARTKISVLDLNILLSYYIDSKESSDKACYKFILKDLLNTGNPINALKNIIDQYGFMFRVIDYDNTSQKISDRFIQIEFSYIKSDVAKPLRPRSPQWFTTSDLIPETVTKRNRMIIRSSKIVLNYTVVKII